MIKRISLATALIATTFTLGACSEVPQGVVAAKKGDEKSYVAADNKCAEKGWSSGDQASWDKQLKTRSLGQDDYVKSK